MAQAAAVALATAVLLGALLLVVPSLASAADESFRCLIGALTGGGGGCAGGSGSNSGANSVPAAFLQPGDQDELPDETYDAPDSGTRPLTPEERALAEEIFGPGALDLDAIRITRDGPFVQDRPYVIGNTIHWPGDTIDTAALAHELTHVYQFQHRGWVYLQEAAVLQAEYEVYKLTGLGSNPYEYGGADGLNDAREDGMTFGDFNVEQQGQIVEDYWELVQDGGDTSAYDPFIDDLRNGDIEDDYEAPGLDLPVPFPPLFPPFSGPTIHVPLPFDVPDAVQPWNWDLPNIWLGPLPIDWDVPILSPPWDWEWEAPSISPPWEWF